MIKMMKTQLEGKSTTFKFKEVLIRNSIFNHVFCIDYNGESHQIFVTKDEMEVIEKGMIQPEKALLQLLAINRARL